MEEITSFKDNVLSEQDQKRRSFIVGELSHIIKDEKKVYSIIDLGCNKGHLLADIKKKYINTIFTGVDYCNFINDLQLQMNYIYDGVFNYVYNTDHKYDITICSWILCHISEINQNRNNISNLSLWHFWAKLNKLSKYLVTFENERLLYFSLFDQMSEKYCQQIYTSKYVDKHEYILRIFQREI
jgi:hypothetical protein